MCLLNIIKYNLIEVIFEFIEYKFNWKNKKQDVSLGDKGKKKKEETGYNPRIEGKKKKQDICLGHEWEKINLMKVLCIYHRK